jgi:hypothetical protein
MMCHLGNNKMKLVIVASLRLFPMKVSFSINELPHVIF